jgi:DNA-binding NarL/FixJ family response regulator
MITCLVCDDHGLVRSALCQMLRQVLPGVQLYEAADFAAGQTQMAALRPGLCLTDLRMPGATPEEGVQALQAASPATPILVVTGSGDDSVLLSLLQRGIAGFLEKTSNLAVIEAAVKIVLAGDRYVPSRILTMIGGSAILPAVSAARDPDRSRLSPRQIEVLDLAAQGFSNKDMARHLSLAPSTVKSHLEQAMRLLGVTNRTQAAAVWRETNRPN